MENINIEIYKWIIGEVYGNVGIKIYDYWQIINNIFWEGMLPIPLITFEILAYGKYKGDYTEKGNRIRISSSHIEISQKTAGLLLHEMIHQSFHKLLSNEEKEKIMNYGQKSQYNCHNNIYWINEINRIHKQVTGEDLGADLRKMSRKNGNLNRIDMGKISYKQVRTYPFNPEIEKKLFDYINKSSNNS